ncbi:uncharacterized protein CLUP02_17275 [Colletotrichum lupini]|uniref:Uncharacterized protein n=1 Tax=Colletotrichum lupini TaxID=145971 RepID=A0A9Q8SFX2_9PEZI|nr:uncharacterized protein CLUP02_17275 [Colletotrichum lupini]UQC75767.1 hypothetical protein CLUP02_17275 [Colletotrichum lupini]
MHSTHGHLIILLMSNSTARCLCRKVKIEKLLVYPPIFMSKKFEIAMLFAGASRFEQMPINFWCGATQGQPFPDRTGL